MLRLLEEQAIFCMQHYLLCNIMRKKRNPLKSILVKILIHKITRINYYENCEDSPVKISMIILFYTSFILTFC